MEAVFLPNHCIFRYLSKYKKVRTKDGGKWAMATMLKYIEEIVAMLGV